MADIIKAASKAKALPEQKCDSAVSPCPREKAIIKGKIELIKISMTTKFDVCDDTIKDFDDYERVFLLRDKGKYYHWLSAKTDASDKKKPDPLPVTFSSKMPIKFTAIFRVIETIGSFKVRVTESANVYKFDTEAGKTHAGAGKGSELPEISFTCDLPLPYEGQAKYLPNFLLSFQYSEDGATWDTAGSASFCLYLTMDLPGFQGLSPSQYERPTDTNKINNNFSFKGTICETYLYIGCKYADGVKTATELINRIFDIFKTLSVSRARYPGAMGYWRNTSSLHASAMPFRNGRVLIMTGEARCGEWTNFLGDLCVVQSGSLFNGLLSSMVLLMNGRAVMPSGYINGAMLVKDWEINDPNAPQDKGGKAQDKSNKPLNMFWDHVFLLYNTEYYDASYGLRSTACYADNKALFKAYLTAALTGAVIVKQDVSNSLIDAIQYLPGPGKFLHPALAYQLTTTSKNKLRYKIITSEMENYISPEIYTR